MDCIDKLQVKVYSISFGENPFWTTCVVTDWRTMRFYTGVLISP